MSTREQRTFRRKTRLFIRIFFRQYPSIPYILKWSFICLLIGICIGSASAGFLISLNQLTRFREDHVWIIALLPLAGLLIGLLYHYRGETVEGGNNLLIDTIHEPKTIVPFRMAPVVYIGTIITHLFGGSAGREGTALQMAGAIADQFSRPLRLRKADRRVLMIAAIAAGFGSVFGTPLAGAVFALEVFLIGRIRYEAIFPAFTAALIADLTTKYWKVEHTHYSILSIPELSLPNLGYAIIAGIMFGLCAATFCKCMDKVSAAFRSTIAYPPIRPLAGGLIVATAVWATGTDKYIGLGIPTIVDSFHHSLAPYDFALKMAFTIVTLSAGFKGGEVTPLFFIGAALGNTLNYAIPLPTGLLAGMGFVAVFAGATNTPLACSIMAIELFGSECGVYTSIACIVAYLLSGYNSIYGRQMLGEAKHRRFTLYEGRRLHDL